MEMFEEYTVFERETHQVVFKEEETRILFQSKTDHSKHSFV